MRLGRADAVTGLLAAAGLEEILVLDVLAAGDIHDRGPAYHQLMRYEPHDKHKSWPSRGVKGARCPDEEAMAKSAVELLAESVPKGGGSDKRYACDGRYAFCAQAHRPEQGLFHGYPVTFREVPAAILTAWIHGGLVTRRHAQRYWEGLPQ